MLVGTASAAIDVSDGLYADLSKICAASGVGALIDVARLPISEHWRSYLPEGQAQEWALTGGDDYQLCFTVPRDQVLMEVPPTGVTSTTGGDSQLCFTVPREQAGRLESWIREGRIVATAIGKITNKHELVLVKNGKPFELERKGYDHFG